MFVPRPPDKALSEALSKALGLLSYQKVFPLAGGKAYIVREIVMKKVIIFGALSVCLLLSTVPAFATIQATLENPGNGTSANGVTAVSGWAFSDTDAAVTIRLRVNGETQEVIPCCSSRQDVQNAFPSASLATGFGLLYNYGLLPSGVHTIGIEVSADGEETVVDESSVTIVKAADAEFLTSLSLDNASVAIQDGNILIIGAEVDPFETSQALAKTTVTTDLTIAYLTSSQTFVISQVQDDLGPALSPYNASQLLRDEAEAIFVAYEELDSVAYDMLTAITTFTSSLTLDNLTAAQTAWRAARIPWEQSEAFLFGPVSDDNRDPKLDSWPVNTVDIESVVASDSPIVIDNLDDTAKGFHTIEYLLFRDGTDQGGDPVAVLAAFMADARRGGYLLAAAQSFVGETEGLSTSWDPNGGNFVDELALAGQGSTTFTSQQAALQELVNGMIGIADELANAKIAVPLADQSNTEEESRFSDNSRRDFIDNIRSINNVYEGRFDQTDGTSMGVTDFVFNQDPALDARVRTAIRDALAAVIAIPETFGNSITVSPATVQAAVDTVQALQATLEEILPVVQAASFTA